MKKLFQVTANVKKTGTYYVWADSEDEVREKLYLLKEAKEFSHDSITRSIKVAVGSEVKDAKIIDNDLILNPEDRPMVLDGTEAEVQVQWQSGVNEND